MSGHQNISGLHIGERVDSVYLLREASLETSPRAGAFWKLKFGDAGGSIPARVWSPKAGAGGAEAEKWEGICGILQEKPAWVKVSGVVSEFNGLQVTVSALSRLSGEEADALDIKDFVASSPKSGGEMLEEIEELCERELVYQPWKKFVFSVLRKDGEGEEDRAFRSRLMQAPAAKMMHHARAGGLLQHSLSVAGICLRIAAHYPCLDRQVLLAAALLHDIGKLEEMTGPLATEYTPEGNLLGHTVQGMLMLEPFLRASELPGDLQAHFLHLIASHHGRAEFGAVKVPETPEAFVLHFADDMDAKIDRCLTIFPEQAGVSQCWSQKGETLCRSVATPGRAGGEEEETEGGFAGPRPGEPGGAEGGSAAAAGERAAAQEELISLKDRLRRAEARAEDAEEERSDAQKRADVLEKKVLDLEKGLDEANAGLEQWKRRYEDLLEEGKQDAPAPEKRGRRPAGAGQMSLFPSGGTGGKEEGER